MLIGLPEDHIQIDRTPPSKLLRVQIKTYPVSGSTYINMDDLNLDQFLSELKQLEETRQGKAALKHLSYESEFRPFHLEIFSIDRLGHMAIKVEINHTHYLQGTQPVANTLSVVLEMDVEKFSSIVHDFINLVN